MDTEPGLADANLKVKVSSSTVLLSGMVRDNPQRQAARRIAESNAGPRKIVDNIQVKQLAECKSLHARRLEQTYWGAR